MVSRGRRVILVQRRERGEKSYLYELRELAEAAGYEVVAEVEQVRPPSSKYQIGPGKVRELAEMVKSLNVDKVIFFNELKPVQAYNLQKELGVEVEDRFQLILEIFASRAGTREAKLQIELARLKRELSFIKEALHLAKLEEFPGYMGGGEYVIDAYYRHAVARISKIERELRRIRERKGTYWVRRVESGLPALALTGYTGAGKTTLFNRLTGYVGYVDGKPFATLSTKVKRVRIRGHPALVSDTIGFIDCLPPLLIDAFYTTLGEILYADLILLLLDVSEEEGEILRKLDASLGILMSLGVPRERIILVANKIDKVGEAALAKRLETLRDKYSLPMVAISALRGTGLRELEEKIIKMLPDYARALVKVPVGEYGLVKVLHESSCVEGITYNDGYVILHVAGKRGWLERLRRRVEEVGGEVIFGHDGLGPEAGA